jgi:DNA-directed RNA polymerase subunit RPC12/RpoP
MSEIRAFFRFCPSCGRRFHIRLVAKNLVDQRREKVNLGRTISLTPMGRYPLPGGAPTIVQEGEPITIDIEEFQYVYKCSHCGHIWSEEHVREDRER